MNLIDKIQQQPGSISFQETIAFIDEQYDFFPTRFTNGEALNEPNQNNGSCKIFSFAQLQNLNKEQTLQLFGDIYRVEVLQDPHGTGHQNIRQFMQHGWEGIDFKASPLSKK